MKIREYVFTHTLAFFIFLANMRTYTGIHVNFCHLRKFYLFFNLLESKFSAPAHCTACKNIQAKQITNLKPNETNGALAIEYWRQADGCRIANVICGSAKV